MPSIRQLEKHFATRTGRIHALGPVSLEVEEGAFVSLLGPSGCGKSTALSIIAGLDQATRGEVLLDGRAISGPGPERGVVFQNYTLFPWLTVRDNARFSLRLARNAHPEDPAGDLAGRSDRADHLLELIGLGAFARSHPRELSGGMKQRVAIVRALVNRPRLLLMDEPFGALDTQTREELQDLVLLLHHHERTTTLFVTHDVEEAIFVSTRVIVFSPRPGRVVADVTVPFSAPERTAALKHDPRFLALKRELGGLLRNPGADDARRQHLLDRLAPVSVSDHPFSL